MATKKMACVFALGLGILLSLAGCSADDAGEPEAEQACAGLSGAEYTRCLGEFALAQLEPGICRQAGEEGEQLCLEALYRAAGEEAICSELYLESSRLECEAYYARANRQPTGTAVAAQPIPTATTAPTFTPTPTPTPDPYAGLSIEELAARSYGGGELRIEEQLEANALFTRSLISYPSDGLTIYGFMNEPVGEGPFPVVLVLHGYVESANYRVLAYSTRYADVLAREGFLVIHPNFRNYPPL